MPRLIDQIVAQDTIMNCHSKPHVSTDVFAIAVAFNWKIRYINVQIHDLRAVVKNGNVEFCGL
jgi:hypothetical protein